MNKKRNMRETQEFVSEEPTGVAERPPVAASQRIEGKRVAVIVADGFEQSEFDVPVRRLREAGAIVEVLAPDDRHKAQIEGESQGKPAAGTQANQALDEVCAGGYDALLIPGGLKSPDTMRQSTEHLAFVRAFVDAGKPVAAICHGPWLLADAGALNGAHVTSWPGIKRDLERAGATWTDEEVVVSANLITSRKPDDAEAFATALIGMIATTAD